MATVSRYTPSIESLRKELKEHPNWKGKESTAELKQDTYAIVEDSSNRFRILWLSKKGERMSVNFWTLDNPTQWCFQNGQSNTFNRLNELIDDIFKHFKEKDIE